MKFLLVVWVDEPKGALADGIACFRSQALEFLDSHTRGSNAHEFVDVTGTGSAYLQQGLIERLGKKVDERQFGGKANGYLLMPAERVVPGRKTKKHDAILFEEVFYMKHENLFVRRINMFYNIMNEYEVELVCFSFGNFCKEEVLADKYPLLMVFCKESLCFFNALLADVYSCHLTAFFCEGKQVASLATADFQDTGIRCKRNNCFHIVKIELAGCVY